MLLVGVGACLLTGDRRVAGIGVVVGLAVCAADWVLVQDLGFFGGVGTDPNSMVPTAFLLSTGYLAMVAPEAARAPAVEPTLAAPVAPARSARTPAYLLQVAGAVLAGAVVLIGAAPMALAAANPHADTILTEAINGTPNQSVDIPAWGFAAASAIGAAPMSTTAPARTAPATWSR